MAIMKPQSFTWDFRLLLFWFQTCKAFWLFKMKQHSRCTWQGPCFINPHHLPSQVGTYIIDSVWHSSNVSSEKKKSTFCLLLLCLIYLRDSFRSAHEKFCLWFCNYLVFHHTHRVGVLDYNQPLSEVYGCALSNHIPLHNHMGSLQHMEELIFCSGYQKSSHLVVSNNRDLSS